MTEDIGSKPSGQETIDPEKEIYGMKLSDLTQERLDAIAEIYHKVVNPGERLDLLKRQLQAESLQKELEKNPSLDVELRLGSSVNNNSKLWIERKSRVGDEEVIDFTFDCNERSRKESDGPHPLELGFKKAVSKYLQTNSLAVEKPNSTS